MHFEDSSSTELKTVHRQNWRQFIDKFYIVFIINVTIFTIYWDTIKQMTNIKLMKLHDCCCTSFFISHTSDRLNIGRWTHPCLKHILYIERSYHIACMKNLQENINWARKYNKPKNKQKSTYSLSISKNSSRILCIVCEFPKKNKVQ